jgi:hypothetical protein
MPDVRLSVHLDATPMTPTIRTTKALALLRRFEWSGAVWTECPICHVKKNQEHLSRCWYEEAMLLLEPPR